MIEYLHAQVDAIRLRVRQRGLRRREQMALARLGRATLADGGSREGRLSSLAVEATTARTRLAALEEERRATATRSRADLAAEPRWMAPVVLVRGAAAQAVIRRRRAPIEQKVRELHLTAGRLAMVTATSPAAREVQSIRSELTAAASEQERRKAELDARPLPAWMERVRAEGTHFGGAISTQLRSQLTPRAPALAGMAVGWWIASTYTDSHARSVLHSLGIGHGGTHAVSASTYKLMHFGLPLLAAALCAYLGQRISAAVRARRSPAQGLRSQ